MDIYSEGGLIFLVMVDHLNGELLGGVIDSFYAAGAKNVQIISSITKKNRPSYIILIDGNENSAEKIENVIINECGSYGWHRISTDHRHTSVSIITKEIEVVLESGSFCFAAKGKRIARDEKNIRPEYCSCLELKNELLKYNKNIPLSRIYMELYNVFINDGLREIAF